MTNERISQGKNQSQNEGHSAGQLAGLFKKSMSGGKKEKNGIHVQKRTKETQ